MADVRRSSPEKTDRGQLMLVAALGLAVMFVTLALTLNTAIYTENLATRGSNLAGGNEALQYRAASTGVTHDLIVKANAEHNESYATLERNLSAGVRDWNSLAETHGAASGAAAETTLVSSNNGTSIRQTAQRNFTDDEGNSTWTVAEDASGTRNFRMNVSKTSLMDKDRFGALGGNVFNVTFESATTTWKVSIYRNTLINTDARIEVIHDGTTFDSCTSSEEFVHINITSETIDGTDCPELGYLDNVSAPYDVTFEHATEEGALADEEDTINGTYDLIVDKKDVGPTPDPYVSDPTNGPATSPAIYNATIRTVYNTSRLDYVSETGVTPGETLAS